ncbi:AI-2E family transporter [Oceanospirillaceae bacterium]|jgi:putative permease|nr:AI-2E family transporter [Oceanospirillaceae bacterium]MBT4998856.1 AI-2E family transporter [Oceanospirillaceae bacterium]MBT5630901.1 AI-2E family transporter [Oceanospirillaceae bacterium]MBT7674436.1 AI-2E family transporter [Oceanospirillaceae bacterium]MDB0001206.1 AI-2E family transporter [Oceanospirillaceae bacterium]
MFKVFRSWLDHFFADEQALLLLVLLAAGLTTILMFGASLAPVITSMILAYLTLGLVEWLERFGVNHLPAVWGIYSLFIALLLTFVFIVLPLLWQQATDLLSNLPLMLEKLMDLFMLLPEQYPELVNANQIKQLADAAMAEVGNSGQLLVSFSLASIGQSLTWLVFLVLVPILVFFFLKDGHMMVLWFTSFLPLKRNILSHVWLEMDQQIANYVRGKVVEIAIVGSVTYVAFLWFGLNYAALLAVIVGISVLIPYIGATLVTIPVALIGYVQWGVSTEFYTLIIVYGIIQALDGNVLVPLLFSEAVNLHPVAIIVAVLFFGSIWGLWGVFFAIPLATLIKAVMNAWPKKLVTG